MPDVDTIKAFFDLGGPTVLAALAIWSVYKVAMYAIAREVENAATQRTVIDKLISTIERNTESYTRLHEAILAWDRHLRGDRK